ncbi:MAG: hypothetical protein IH874_01875 [Candidatus Dadabacteria bacterium]|nr:hypothetical protein [Candidatus Dadabacteria bacterium]
MNSTGVNRSWVIGSIGICLSLALLFLALSCKNETAESTREDAEIRKKLEERTRNLRKLEFAVEDSETILSSIKEGFSKNAYGDIAEHAEEISKKAQSMRQYTIDLEGAEYTLLNRDIRNLQHSAHELEEKAQARQHAEAHHSAQMVEEALETLKEDLRSAQRK